MFYSVNISWHQSSTVEILPCGLRLHKHLTVLAFFLSRLVTPIPLTEKVSLPYSIKLRTQAAPFAPKD